MAQRTNWLARWRELVEDREAQRMRWGKGAPPEQWGSRSANFFSQMARDLSPDDPAFLYLRDSVRRTDTVLDVGAGAGRYALAIAPYVREVVAFDPSRQMLDALSLLISERGITNIRTVHGSWPNDANMVPDVDVVFCAHSFYWSPDIEPFLRAVAQKARHRAMCVIRVEQQDLYLYELIEELRGETRSPEPNAVELLGALKQMGIYADLTTVHGYGRTYGSVAEVAANAATMLGFDQDEAPHELLVERLAPLVVESNGRYLIGKAIPLAGVVSWETDRKS